MFFSFVRFWFSGLSGGWKGKKWLKITNISVCLTSHFSNYISYDLHLWYTFMYERMIYPDIIIIIIIILSKFWFSGSVGGEGKRAKNGSKWQNSVCLTWYIRNSTSYYCDFWYTCVKWYLLQIFWFFKILVFGVFTVVKGQKMT